MRMDYNKTYNKILTDEEFMEIKPHGSSDYPFQYYYDNLELFDFHCIEWHWHREFEFLYVESGKVLCGIGEKQIILSEGDAIFINSKILHRFYASSGGVIPNLLRRRIVWSIKNIFYQSFHRIWLSSVFRVLNHGRQGLYKL